MSVNLVPAPAPTCACGGAACGLFSYEASGAQFTEAWCASCYHEAELSGLPYGLVGLYSA